MSYIFLLLTVSILHLVSSESLEEYNRKRKFILLEEENTAIGGSKVLSPLELQANQFLTHLKNIEIEEGFRNPAEFPPARNFLKAKDDIEKSRVFKLLRRFPKGASLHGHDTALVSVGFLVKNITYRENLYGKFLEDDIVELKFFEEQPDEEWKSVEEIRNRRENFDEWMSSQLSLNEIDAGLDTNAVWKKFVALFRKITPMLTYEPVWKDHFYQTLKEFHEDNVSYLEFRGTLPPIYRLDGTKLNATSSCGLYVEVLETFKSDYPEFIGARFIYAPHRSVNVNTFEEYIATARELKELYPDFVAGFDLVGQEDLGDPLLKFADKILETKGEIDFFFHAGETKWNGLSTDENLIDAVLLGTKRIGHGYAITKHPKVAKDIKKLRIGIEISPISNQVLGLVNDLRNHPAAVLLADDYPVVISSDDPGFWGAKGVSYDWYETFMGIASKHQDLHLLKQLALNSIEQTSLSADEKKNLLEDWTKRWEDYIKFILKEAGGVRRE